MFSSRHIPLRVAGLLLLAFIHAAQAEDVVPVVSSRSPVSSLTSAHLVDIFLGREGRFPNGEPAIPIDQAEGTREREEFYKRFAGRSAAQLKAYWAKLVFTGKGQPPREVWPSEKVRQAVAENPNFIGYINRSELDGSLKVVVLQGR